MSSRRTQIPELQEEFINDPANPQITPASASQGLTRQVSFGNVKPSDRAMAVALSNLSPIRRSGRPLDIAEAALWLASDASSYVNGQAIAVDGGLTTGPTFRSSRARMESMFPFLAEIGNADQ